MTEQPTIIYTLTDEAPLLATYAFLPVVRAFAGAAGIDVETSDISVAARILAEFSDYLTEEQRVPDNLAALGKLTQLPETNIIKLPNISASVPQLLAAIKELKAKGYDLPDYPGEPKTDEEKKIKQRYGTCLGSAVNPVLREGNSDRRAPKAVKEYARKHPHSMGEWSQASRTHVATMRHGDFYHGEKSMTLDKAHTVRMELKTKSGETLVLKPEVKLDEGDVIDSMFMSKKALCEFYEDADAGRLRDRRDVLAARQGDDDEGQPPHRLRPRGEGLLQGRVRQASEAVRRAGRQRQQRSVRPLRQDRVAARVAARGDHPRPARLPRAPSRAGDGRLGEGHHQLPLAQRRDRRRVDARDDPRSAARCTAPTARLKDTKAVNPESTFSRIYQEIINFCKTHGQFDPTTMGTVPNVGLMAQKAEEYGSHDKTFEIPEDGVADIVDVDTGEVLLTQNVEEGDIWRMPVVKDAPIRDWVKLAVTRARESGMPVVFWLDQERPHENELRTKVNTYLKDHDTEGLDISIMSQVRAMRHTIERAMRGQDTIAATGNILRDYLTDLFPILELGTSAKMLSIVPLMAGGGLYETGAGGSAPKHVSQLVEENHLRWDSLGEFLALAASLEDLGNKTDNQRATILAKTLDSATGKLLDENKNPSRKTGELDNRGSQFYLAMYWAQELAAQTEDKELAEHFAPLAKALAENEDDHRRRTQRGAGRFGRHRRLLLPGSREDHGGDAAEQDVQRGAGVRSRLTHPRVTL